MINGTNYFNKDIITELLLLRNTMKSNDKN